MFIDFNAEEHPPLPPQVACELHEQQPGENANDDKSGLIRKPSEKPDVPPVYTTMALGEEGGDDTPPDMRPDLPDPEETFPVTTMAIGEEG